MDSEAFDGFFKQSRQIAQSLATLFEDLTGEELDVNSTIKHYPLVAAGIAAGAGLAAGLWIGRKSAPQLPPPKAPPYSNPLEYLDQVLPDSLKKVRDFLPESVTDDASLMARTWMEGVLEPKIKQGLDSVAHSVTESKIGVFLKEAYEHMEQSEDTRLEDPPEEA